MSLRRFVLGSQNAEPEVGSIIITEDLSRALFPSGNSLGKTVYLSDKPTTIVGIVADLEVPSVGTRTIAYRSLLLPVRFADPGGNSYIVRTQPRGHAEHIEKSVINALYKTSRLRILDRKKGAQQFHTLRSRAYANDRGLVILLTSAAIILLLATAGGIFGTTTFWVDGRRRSLGMRRALGARRRDILAYIFGGKLSNRSAWYICCGSLIALAANISLMHYLALKSLPPTYITLTDDLFVLVLWSMRSATSGAPRRSRAAN